MHERLEQLEAAFEAANVRVGEATWNIYSGEADADLDEAQRQLARILTNPSSRALVESCLAREATRTEPLRARRLAIWRNCFDAAAVENLPEIYTLTSYPVYWHNYILASVIAAQVHETITARFGAEASLQSAVADYLKENFYASGNAVTWTERIVRGTGAPLGTDAYLRRLHPESSSRR